MTESPDYMDTQTFHYISVSDWFLDGTEYIPTAFFYEEYWRYQPEEDDVIYNEKHWKVQSRIKYYVLNDEPHGFYYWSQQVAEHA